jgi:tetratricopeptide (TPR) repeat protein
MARRISTLLVLGIVTAGGCQATDDEPAALLEHGHAFVAGSGAGVPLYTDLGTHSYVIGTAVPEAQRYFDQGLRLTYAFNHAEAMRAFEEAARLDPSCAMCYWGKALTLGPNINAPMDSASGIAAYEAVQHALSLAEQARPAEQAMIRALAQRYAAEPPASRAALDSAYARAMGEVVRQYPDDLEGVTLYAEALMDLSPWDYWNRDGSPRRDTPTILAQLERVLERNPDHPGACHFYIHAVEAAHPERAVACAERLASLMPGAGHLVHMPAHIYIRVGRWNDAIVANEHAVHADESYLADQRPEGIYPLAYYPHNYHFLSFAATMAGRREQAIAAARDLVERVPVDAAREIGELQGLLPYHHLTLVTFGRWEDVLRTPPPPVDLPFASALTEYARGVAFAATGGAAEAQEALERVGQAAAGADEGVARAVLEIAYHALAGEIDLRADRLDAAIGHFREAARLEDALPYMEPPFWYYPIRHSLGVALLKAGRAADAERIYREDLGRFPENAWSLAGLTASLRAQGRDADATDAARRLDQTLAQADVQLRASRF